MQNNYPSRYLVTIDVQNEMKSFLYETYRFDEPFFTLKPIDITV